MPLHRILQLFPSIHVAVWMVATAGNAFGLPPSGGGGSVSGLSFGDVMMSSCLTRVANEVLVDLFFLVPKTGNSFTRCFCPQRDHVV